MKSLPDRAYAATQHRMRGRFSSLLVFLGLFFSIVVAPAMAHASAHSPLHASELVDIHEIDPHQIDSADHKHSQGSDKDMPCHAVSHHHCGAALPFDVPRIGLNALSKAILVRPGATTPLVSRSQAPPLDPPLA
jgi:ABC-type nickel/cobalt efflux system permease component RcnA